MWSLMYTLDDGSIFDSVRGDIDGSPSFRLYLCQKREISKTSREFYLAYPSASIVIDSSVSWALASRAVRNQEGSKSAVTDHLQWAVGEWLEVPGSGQKSDMVFGLMRHPPKLKSMTLVKPNSKFEVWSGSFGSLSTL